jgi:hypothetical protein
MKQRLEGVIRGYLLAICMMSECDWLWVQNYLNTCRL